MDISEVNIQKENDRIKGLYPMTYEVIKQQIQKVDAGAMIDLGRGYYIGEKAFMFVHASYLQRDPERMYIFYIESVKPKIFEQ